MYAIRSYYAQIIVCDEIGSEQDVFALENALHCGVKVIATAHAGSISEAKKRRGISKLLEIGAFNCIVLLGTGDKIGQIIKMDKIGDTYD